MASKNSEKDIGWQHGYCKDPKNKIAVTCNYCGNQYNGGIFRLKQHIVGGFRNVSNCPKAPEHIKEAIVQYMMKKDTLKKQIRMVPDIDEVDMDSEEENEVDVANPRGKRVANEDIRGSKTKRVRQGPTGAGGSIHSFFKSSTASEKGKGGKQGAINEVYKKEYRADACTYLARWIYEAAIPFNAVKLDSFKKALNAVGRYGIGMKAPSYHEIRVPLLKKELAHTNDLLKSHKEEWAKTGCSIMSDGWVDRNNRSIINFLVNCSKGSMFLESVDASAYSQIGERKAELLSRIIEKVGPSNVVQVVTDNDSTYKLAGKLLEVKYMHIYWTPCAAHCLDLMLEDIGKIPTIATTIKRAVEASGYIYQRVGLVNLLRRFTNQKNLIRPAKTRFATSFLTLQSFHNQKGNLRKMFASTEWTSSKWSKEQGGKRACHTILMPSFWNNVLFILKVSSPLVEVLRLVDGEKRPAMGYIYEAMDRAKETIATHFKGAEEKYKNIFEIIDQRWECQLHRPLHAAGYFLNPAFYYANSDAIEADEEVMSGFISCLEKSVPDLDMQDKISEEVSKYKKADGLFGSNLAKRHRTTKAPADWWAAYGSSTPALQKFATRILSLTCSSSGCERNWSVFEQSDSEYMAGQLSTFGYAVSDNPDEADLWLINTCTVKSPSQSAMDTLISKCKSVKKPLVVAGCVPQGSRDLKELEGISVIGVQQIDRVVEVVEETLKGHEVRLLSRKILPSLDLPKVRKNRFIEILPINVGCLGACTYCKTKHARGHLGSYTIDSLVGRVRAVISEGVKEIWLSSEDTGAYGRDIGTNFPLLLNAIVAELPPDSSTMLRIGMTNPPYILEHLKEIAKIMCHPSVYSFLHVPVQSGSDSVLEAMNREYTVSEFRTVVDTLNELVPGMQIATDIICGFPGETDEDFAQTVSLIKEYQFSQVHISQFYPRPGTPAARMKKVPSTIVKKRSRELTSIFESFNPYQGMEGRIERIWITEIATDGIHLVGHAKGYIQVLVMGPESLLGISTDVRITSVGRWSVFGEVIGDPEALKEDANSLAKASPATNSCSDCTCSREEPDSITVDSVKPGNGRGGILANSMSSLLRRKRTRGSEKKRGEHEMQNMEEGRNTSRWATLDWILVGGIFASFIVIVRLLILISSS